MRDVPSGTTRQEETVGNPMSQCARTHTHHLCQSTVAWISNRNLPELLWFIYFIFL